MNEDEQRPERASQPPAGGDAAPDDARAAAIAAAKAKAAQMAAARGAAPAASDSAAEGQGAPPAGGGQGSGAAAAPGPAQPDAVRAAAIAAAKAKAAAAARAQSGAGAAGSGAGATPGAAAAPRPAPAPKAPPPPPPPPPLDPALAPIKALLQKALPDASFDERTFRIIGIEVDRDHLLDVARRLYDMPETRMDYLACLSGVDYPDGIEVVYHLASTRTPAEVALRVKVPKDAAECHVPSVTGIWAGANWHEREAFDLLGVRFEGHPDLRRILLPEGFAGGYPLRKDFQDTREPREIKVRTR